MKSRVVIAQVRKSKSSGQKTVTIPKTAKIRAGDYIVIRRIRK